MTYQFLVPKIANRGDEVLPVGVNFDSRVSFIKRNRHIIVLHMTGGSHWAGQGSRGYHGARFVVYNILTEVPGDAHTRITADELVEFAPKAGGK